MIKAVGRKPDGTPIVLVGLAGENMTRLMADESIRFNLADFALPDIEVMIIGGRTEDDILQALVAGGFVDKAMVEAAQNAPDGHATR